MSDSLDDVFAQMRAAGIDPPDQKVVNTDGKVFRWKPAGQAGAKKTAWAFITELRSRDQLRTFFVGSFGNKGDAPVKIENKATDWTPEERADWVEKRRAAEKLQAAERRKEAETAAKKADRMWEKGRTGGKSAYLERKQVGAFGLRFLFGSRIMVPVRNVHGELQGLQYIGDDGEKVFGTGTEKAGRFHLLGAVRNDGPIAFAEGYATAATVHMATGWPVVMCFDAGNLDLVVGAWRAMYASHQFIICADDDRHLVERLAKRLRENGVAVDPADLARKLCDRWALPDGSTVLLDAAWKKNAHGVFRLDFLLEVTAADGKVRREERAMENAGRTKAIAAARKHVARVIFPRFADTAGKGTDWNDLHCAESLDVCRAQLLATPQAQPVAQKFGAAPPGGEDEVRPIEQMLERYVLLYGTTTVWDRKTREIVKIESLKLAWPGWVEEWLEDPARVMIERDKLVFDPTNTVDPETHVNIFDGLGTMPNNAGSCELLIEHLTNLCHRDEALFEWVSCWLAYPLQHPGAKMETALVMHGMEEGTGKSLLMKVMRKIYGRYGRKVTQLQLQSEFTGWLSQMLFCVAEEVVTQQEKKHLKGLLKDIVTGEEVPINEKMLALRYEANHANFVFLSNEQQPLVLDPRDRRYTVINVEERRPESYFSMLGDEIDAGGIEAFHFWLLNLDLKGFTPYTKPFENRDRMVLITLGMPAERKFLKFWTEGQADLPVVSCRFTDLYTAFRAWCRVSGERFVASSTSFASSIGREFVKKKKRLKTWSDKTVMHPDGLDLMADQYAWQGVVWLVPPELRPKPKPRRDDAPAGDGETSRADAVAEITHANLLDDAFLQKEVQEFQKALALLVARARRTL